MSRLIICMTAAALACTPAFAAKKAPQTWKAVRTIDPITGSSRCVISALDHIGNTRFSRTGYLYPVIEHNSTSGLLVGISSGGRYRLPTGTIVWRVDDKPFRELKAEDNPPSASAASAHSPTDEPAQTAVNSTMALTNRLILAATATSTLASGDKAAEMLAELRDGRGLLFRAAPSADAYGLPARQAGLVGQITKDGLRPVPLDESLESSLAECGIK